MNRCIICHDTIEDGWARMMSNFGVEAHMFCEHEFSKIKGFKLTDELRQDMKTIFGNQVMPDEVNEIGKNFIITVGDMVTASFLEQGIIPDVAIFDYKTKRTSCNMIDKYISLLNPTMKCVVNPPGELTIESLEAVLDAISTSKSAVQPLQIMVVGEEDLLVIPALMFAPEKSYVIYGVPDVGMYAIEMSTYYKILGMNMLFSMDIIKRNSKNL